MPLTDLTSAGLSIADTVVTEEFAVEVDTADRRLAAAGARLVHRSTAGPTGPGTWTLLFPTLDPPPQWVGDAAAVPGEARRLLTALAGGADLDVVGRSATTRRVHTVDDRGTVAGVVVEDTVDDGSGRRHHFEVLPGARKKLRRALPTDRPSPAPSGAPAGGEQTTGAWLERLVAAGLAQLLAHDVRIRLDGDAGSIHQARVATRRLRSDLKTVSDVVDPVWAATVRNELSWLGDRLGAVRDLDVLAGRLEGDLTGVGELVAVARAERAAALGELSVALDSPRYLDLLDTLVAGPPTPGPALPQERVGRSLGRMLARPARQLSKAAAVAKGGDAGAIHATRIRAKQLRYAAEAAAPVLGRRTESLARAAKDLQTVLGEHHDAVATEAWLASHAPAASAGAAFAAGVLLAEQRAEQARLAASWQRQWREVERAARRALR